MKSEDWGFNLQPAMQVLVLLVEEKIAIIIYVNNHEDFEGFCKVRIAPSLNLTSSDSLQGDVRC